MSPAARAWLFFLRGLILYGGGIWIGVELVRHGVPYSAGLAVLGGLMIVVLMHVVYAQMVERWQADIRKRAAQKHAQGE